MTQEKPTTDPQEGSAQTEQPEEAGQQRAKEPQYYHSINRYWTGPGSSTRRIHHKSEDCRIGRRIREQNRIAGRRDDTSPCPVCCMDEIVQQGQNRG